MSRLRAYLLALVLASCVGFLVSRCVPPHVLEVTLATSVDGVAQCYFDRGAGLSEQDSVRQPLHASRVPTRHRFPLAPGSYKGIRFDPLDRAGAVRITAIDVRDALGRTVVQVDLGALDPANDVTITEREADGTLVLRCTGADPQLGLRFDRPASWVSTAAAGVVGVGAAFAVWVTFIAVWELSRTRRVRSGITTLGQAISASTGEIRAPWRNAAGAIVIVALAAEMILFLAVAAPRYAAVYPRWNDQIQYLAEAYTAHEFSNGAGCWRALVASIVNPSAQGTLHDVYTTLVFAVSGPSRVAALSLNVVALVAWQIANFFAARRVTRSSAVAVVAALAPALGAWQWQDLPGSAFDFRLDHLAMCLLGITAAFALIAAETPARRWSIALGLAAGTLIAARFLTATYVLGVFAIGLVLAASLRRMAHLRSFAVAGITCAAVASPILFLNRHLIYNYYVVGHYFGEESRIRNQHFGVAKSIGYVLHGALVEHAGSVLLGAMAAGVVAAAVQAARARHERGVQGNVMGVVGAVFTLVPLTVLTLHAQKSPVVLGALLPGLVWIGVAGLSAARGLFTGFAPVFAAGFGLLTLASVTVRLWHAGPPPDVTAVSGDVYRIAELIYRDAHTHGRDRVSIATDHITDGVDAQVFRVLTYEKHHVWIDYGMALSGIGAPRENDVLAAFERSDYLIVTRAGGIEAWPFDTALKAMRPSLLSWCARNGSELATFELAGRHVVLFRNRHEAGPSAAASAP